MCFAWQVVGIWFYDTEECEKVITLLKGIASQHPQPPQPPTDEGGASYPLTIGSLPHQSPAQPNVRLRTTIPSMPLALDCKVTFSMMQKTKHKLGPFCIQVV